MFKKGEGKKGSWLAAEVIHCNGQFCQKSCPVALQLLYNESHVKINYSTTDHGILFKPDVSKLKLSRKVRTEIFQQETNNSVGYSTTPSAEFLRISHQLQENALAPTNSALLPSKKQIANILQYERGKNVRGNEEEKIKDFINNSNSVIYPKKSTFNLEPMIIVMKAREGTIIEFIKNHATRKIFGIDSQYVNNKFRFPLTVMATSNDNHNVVPGFIMLSSRSDAHAYSKFLRVVIKFLKSNFQYELSGYCMHDKDDAELLACKSNNLQSLLCEFHAVKLFEEKIPKYFSRVEERVDCLLKIKRIQRSSTEENLKQNIIEFQNFCKTTPKFWQYFNREWLGQWKAAWLDLNRPGGRQGIFNTNNLCESFFKTLYHTFLKRRSRNPAQLLIEIQENVFLYYENSFIKQNFRRNPSSKIKQFEVVDFDDHLGQITLLDKENEVVVALKDGKCDCSTHPIQGKCAHLTYCSRFEEYIKSSTDNESDSEILLELETEDESDPDFLLELETEDSEKKIKQTGEASPILKPNKKRGRKKKHLTILLRDKLDKKKEKSIQDQKKAHKGGKEARNIVKKNKAKKPLEDVECETLVPTKIVSSRGRLIKRRKIMDL